MANGRDETELRRSVGMDDSNAQCHGCRWYNSESEYNPAEGIDGRGECRVSPPVPATNALHRGRFPRVYRNDYCGAWAARL